MPSTGTIFITILTLSALLSVAPSDLGRELHCAGAYVGKQQYEALLMEVRISSFLFLNYAMDGYALYPSLQPPRLPTSPTRPERHFVVTHRSGKALAMGIIIDCRVLQVSSHMSDIVSIPLSFPLTGSNRCYPRPIPP